MCAHARAPPFIHLPPAPPVAPHSSPRVHSSPRPLPSGALCACARRTSLPPSSPPPPAFLFSRARPDFMNGPLTSMETPHVGPPACIKGAVPALSRVLKGETPDRGGRYRDTPPPPKFSPGLTPTLFGTTPPPPRPYRDPPPLTENRPPTQPPTPPGWRRGGGEGRSPRNRRDPPGTGKYPLTPPPLI